MDMVRNQGKVKIKKSGDVSPAPEEESKEPARGSAPPDQLLIDTADELKYQLTDDFRMS